MELGKPAMEYKVVSIFLLKLAKFLPAFQLEEEYPSFCVLSYTGFPLPIFKKVLILPRTMEDLEPKFDRVARPTIIANERFVGVPFYLQIICDLFRIVGVKGKRNGSTRARTCDLSIYYGRVSVNRVIAMRKLSLTLVYPPNHLRPGY